MFNKVIMLGNVTRDIELSYLPSGGAVAKTGLATNRKFKKQDGSQGEEVCFIDVTFFGRTAEIANQYLSKGKKVLVEGRLKLDQWTDQQGVKRSKHSITVESLQMLGGNQTAQEETPNLPTHNGIPYEYTDQHGKPLPTPDIDINEDEIPF